MYHKNKNGVFSFRQIKFYRYLAVLLVPALIILISINCKGRLDSSSRILKKVDFSQGICALLGDKKGELAIRLAQSGELLIYVQLDNDEDLETARQAIDEAGFYGTRIFIEKGDFSKIHLADNLADVLLVPEKETQISKNEALRVLRPGGKAILGKREIIKPFPEGVDDWSHPYHGPDNNPQSTDSIARAPYLTQFLAEPYYAPLIQVAVASGGRIFKAYGNIAMHEREEALLNSLVAYNGYNGTMLWKRKLTPGVMIHRNTMIATPEILYVGDDKSCKMIDASTGKLIKEIVPPLDIAEGTFWKWMALEDGILYALVGAQEQKDPVVKQKREEHGWPWDPISKGFNQPEHPWGYGHNLLAINPKNNKVIWSHREDEDIDSRALCMKNGRIYVYKYGTFLACIDAKTGHDIWRKTPDNSPGLFNALGEYLHRQGAETNFRTTAYLKCSDKALYFSGPTVDKLLAISTDDGSILWEDPYNNFQLVLRDEGLFGISGAGDHLSKIFDPLTGRILAELNTRRIACTRPTGSIDAIFYRSKVGSVRMDMVDQSLERISPMRPSCFDGVIIANGLLYWWPSVCDCDNTLYGITCLGPAGDFDFSQKATEKERLEQYDWENVAEMVETPADWPTFRANNYGNVTTETEIPEKIDRLWWFAEEKVFTPTAPVAVGDLVFFSGSDGMVRALNSATGDIQWKAYTGGPVRFPPTIWEGRVFVGSGDGWVYAFEAKSGRILWKFNAAPVQRKIPVYGSLMSTWPVASGVLVEDGIAYFAAGIVNYDGTHVYALDAKSGKIKWQNNTSGHLNPELRTGVSVQGHMLINNRKLFLASGTSVSPAVFDLKDGQCLNDPSSLKLDSQRSTRGMELYKIGDRIMVGGQPFYGHPEYPVYDMSCFNKLLYTSADNKDVVLINNRIIRCYEKMDKQTLDNLFSNPAYFSLRNRYFVNWDFPFTPLWECDCGETVALARCKNAIVYSSKPLKGHETENIVKVIDINDGKIQWGQILPSAPLPWGLAVDRHGRIIVVMKDGQIMCFG